MRKKSLIIGIIAVMAITAFFAGCTTQTENTEAASATPTTPTMEASYPVIETGQVNCYDNADEITCPAKGEAFYGQDAQYSATQFSYVDNGDGTITDLNTGLMWQQSPAGNGLNFDEADDYCDSLDLAGYDDWRMPTTKELFSISDFSEGWPYLDTTYFDLAETGSVSKDEQYWTERYVGTTVEGGSNAAFGVNHGTGHIKAYPAGVSGRMGNYVRAVRGDTYGVNDFSDNGDGTVTDRATGLMWQQADSSSALDWENALAYADKSTLAGYDDWRLPNVKELQSIVDYAHSPSAGDAADVGPAIDTDYFEVTEIPSGMTDYSPDYGYYWSGTSAYFGGDSPEYYYAWYVAFGTAVGNDGADFHGAGAVRFDTKVEGGAAGEGGERYYNYVRLVRDSDAETGSISPVGTTTTGVSYPIVDTGQVTCYNTINEITCPAEGEAFYGQDAQYSGNQPAYTLSGDQLTVYDSVTGLTWQRSPDTNGDGEILADDKLTLSETQEYPDTLNAENFGGYSDWRLPTIKEQYSLIIFSGRDPSGVEGTDTSSLTPFIDTDYFRFAYGDTDANERIIDSQYASDTLYVYEESLLFGVNFADGRIKGYGLSMPGGREKTFFVTCVRGNPDYGINDFTDNGDGTITDAATGLIWSQADSGTGMNWKDALTWVQTKNSENYLGYSDWRLPNVKELQSIVDYTRSPDTTDSAAIDPLFACTAITNEAGETDYPYFWSGTTHATSNGNGGFASYVCFGRAMGYMDGVWQDVHGAGAQKSDPKSGDVSEYPEGHGPQGDAVRIDNFVRLVRG